MCAAIKIGTFVLLLPVYFTVAHRMFPFFAGNVVKGYKPWRPMWLLGAFWPLTLAHLALELVHGYQWLWIADVPLLRSEEHTSELQSLMRISSAVFCLKKKNNI